MSTEELGYYGRLARWLMHNRGITIAMVAFITLVSAFFAKDISIDSDILKLMPADDPATAALKKLDEEEGGANVLTIAVKAPDATVRDAFLDDLATQLRTFPEVDYVLYKLDPKTSIRLGVLQLPKEDLLSLRDRLKAALSMGSMLSNPFIAGKLFDFGPLTEKLENAGEGLRLSSKDVGRLIVHPTGSAHDIPFARGFMKKVDATLDSLKPDERGVKILWKGGAYRHNVEDYEGISKDIVWTTGTALVLVLIIIAAAFRAPRAVALIFIPLILSNIWTAGIAAATVGSLNTFTSFVNAIIIGLGVEFGVHLYARFREERANTNDRETAVIRAWDAVGGSCTSAAFTSSAGFAALLAAHFAGFNQLGWMLSLGLILTLIAELICMPVLLTVMEPKLPHAHSHKHGGKRKRKFPVLYRLAPIALLVVTIVTGVSALLIPRMGFQYDLSELRREGMAYADLSETERALARDSYSPLIVDYPDETSLETDYDRLAGRVASGDWPEIVRVLSIWTVLPRDQQERVEIIKEIISIGDDPRAVYFPPKVRESIQKLKEADVQVLAPTDLPDAIQHILGAKGGKHRLLLIPGGNMWDMREADHLVETVRRELPNRVVAGEYITLGGLYEMMLHDAPIIAGIAALLVCFFTWTDLRSWQATLGAILVQVAGLCWWGALLVLSDIRLSIVNFVGIPIVMGIGIDVMIHMIHRLKHEGPGRIVKVLSTTGWASALGTSTTVVAFAALSLASSQGIRSLGLLVLLGETAVTVAGFILVPLGFASVWFWERRHRQEELEELAEKAEHKEP